MRPTRIQQLRSFVIQIPLLGALISCGGGGSSQVIPATLDTGESCLGSGAGSATLSWTPPTTNEDGSPVDLAGYKIYCRTAVRIYFQIVPEPGALIAEAGALDTSVVIHNLEPGAYYFAVTAVNKNGLESFLSNAKSKVVN
jgi:Fibronectin type III domain